MAKTPSQYDARLLDLPYCNWQWDVARSQMNIVNCALENICQVKKESCTEKESSGWIDLLPAHKAARIQSEVMGVLRHQNDFHVRLQVPVEDKIHHMILHGIVAERAADGTPVKIVGISRQEAALKDEVAAQKDFLSNALEEKRKLESILHNAQRLADITQISGSVAHDLNNLLSPIRMSVELLKRKLQDDSVNRYVEIIEDSTARARAVVQQLITFAKEAEAGKQEDVDVNQILHELERMIGATFPKRLSVYFEYGDNLPTIRINSSQLHQALLNLLINARDAMPGNGCLKVSSSCHLQSVEVSVTGRTLYPGPYVTISIQDSGCGIPKEIQDRIFEPFFTTKEKDRGTGLGLPSVAGIITAAGGYIDMSSVVGKGSTFTVCLPAKNLAPTKPNG